MFEGKGGRVFCRHHSALFHRGTSLASNKASPFQDVAILQHLLRGRGWGLPLPLKQNISHYTNNTNTTTYFFPVWGGLLMALLSAAGEFCCNKVSCVKITTTTTYLHVWGSETEGVWWCGVLYFQFTRLIEKNYKS